MVFALKSSQPQSLLIFEKISLYRPKPFTILLVFFLQVSFTPKPKLIFPLIMNNSTAPVAKVW